MELRFAKDVEEYLKKTKQRDPKLSKRIEKQQATNYLAI